MHKNNWIVPSLFNIGDSHSKLAQTKKVKACTEEMSGSNLRQDIHYSEIFCCFSQFVQENFQILSQIRPHSLPSTSTSICYAFVSHDPLAEDTN
jgi:hypothetical protein